MSRSTLTIAALLMFVASAAQAHVGGGDTPGFIPGFVHPISGIDHILAVVAVGLFAVHLGDRALWFVPLSFLSAMTVGGVFGMAGAGLPFVEIGVGLSVVVLGVAVACRIRLSTAAAMALVGFFAIFHGHAHGAEMPQSTSGLEYAAGFMSATALLHGLGIGLGLAVGRAGEVLGGRVLQTTGSAMALAGVAILGGYL